MGAVSARPPELMISTDTVLHAAQRMLAGRETALVVIDAGGRPEGIVTADDLVARCVARNRAPGATILREVMNPAVHTVRHEADVEVALQMMARDDVTRLVVVDAMDRVMGVVSLDDLLWGILAHREGSSGIEKLLAVTPGHVSA